jgi:hypothetical protein
MRSALRSAPGQRRPRFCARPTPAWPPLDRLPARLTPAHSDLLREAACHRLFGWFGAQMSALAMQAWRPAAIRSTRTLPVREDADVRGVFDAASAQARMKRPDRRDDESAERTEKPAG